MSDAPDRPPPDPRDLLDAIGELKTEIFMLRTALDRIVQLVAQDATIADATRREIDRVARVARKDIPQGD